MDWREGFDESRLNEEALTFLIQHELDGPAAGITKQVIARGLGSLSQRSPRVFSSTSWTCGLWRTCKCGNHEVEGHELIGLWSNDGYCSRCAERMDTDARREGV